jgi:hypothetical protein
MTREIQPPLGDQPSDSKIEPTKEQEPSGKEISAWERRKEVLDRTFEANREGIARSVEDTIRNNLMKLDPQLLAVLAQHLETESGDVWVTVTRHAIRDIDSEGNRTGDFRLWDQRPESNDGHFDATRNGKALVADSRAEYHKIKEVVEGLIYNMEVLDHVDIFNPQPYWFYGDRKPSSNSYVDRSDMYKLKRKESTQEA